MSMSWEDDVLRELAKFDIIVEEPIEYRIHYNVAGEITQCTMQNHPQDSTYIVVTKEEYDTYYYYTVVDGKLKKIDRTPNYSVQLKKSTTGYKVVKNHAGLILEPHEDYNEIEYYDRNS